MPDPFPTTVKPTRFESFTRKYDTLSFVSEDSGLEQRSSRILKVKRGFRFFYDVIFDDYETMRDFFKTQRGSSITFPFDPHDFDSNFTTETINVRFTHDKLDAERKVGGGVYSFTMELIEVFTP